MLKYLKIKNFYCHKNFETEFKTGVNCIVGSNAKGKSTLVTAIYSGLTNSYEHPDGMKGSIKQGASEAKIEVEFDEFTVTREIGDKNKHLLTVGEEQFRSAKEIENILFTRFNIVKAILDKFVFIRQGKFTEILGLSDSDRAKMLAYLSNVEYFETLWKRLADEMKAHENALSGTTTFDEHSITAQVETLTEEVSTLKFKYDNLTVELSKFNESDCNYYLDLQQQLNTAKSLVSSYTTDIHRLENDVRIALETITKCNNELLAIKSDYAKAELTSAEMADYYEWQKYIANTKIIEKLNEEKVTVEKSLSGFDEEQTNERIAKYNDEASKLADRQSRLKLQLTIALNTSQGKDCEVCGAKPEHQFKGNASVIESTLNKVIKDKEKVDSNLRLSIVNIQSAQHRQQRLTQIEQELNNIQIAKIENNTDYYKALETRYSVQLELLPKVEQAQINLQVATNNHNNIRQSLEAVQAALANSQLTINKATQIESDAALARANLNRINELKLETTVLNTQINEKTNSVNQYKALLKQVAQKAKQKRLQKYVDLLEEVRGLTHRNNIPHIISKRFLNQLIVQLNGYLDQFNSPFKAIVGDDLGFKVEMLSGAIVPASILSGGQKAMLAMAFWLSVFQLNAERIGLLVMDEPGDGLDASNRKLFNNLLIKVDEILRKQGQQLILISHDEELIGNFHTIAL